MKVLDISFNILIPVKLWTVNGTEAKEAFLYFDGTVKYFQGEHIPFALLAIGMLCIFNVFPLLLLAVYPSQCFQRCLNHCHCQCQILRMFMDNFQGGFKTEPHDYRYFAAFYLFEICEPYNYGMDQEPFILSFDWPLAWSWLTNCCSGSALEVLVAQYS